MSSTKTPTIDKPTADTIATLQHILGHSNPYQTIRYIGIDQKEVDNTGA